MGYGKKKKEAKKKAQTLAILIPVDKKFTEK